MPRHNTPADFWARVKIGAPDECWPWVGPVTDRGYGKLSYGGKNKRAHQVSFFLKNGFYPPFTLHKCDNPPCCNPDHLFAGDHASNMRDMATKGRAWKPGNELHPMHKLTDVEVAEIRSIGRTVRAADLAARFRIHTNYVHQLLRGARRT